MQCDSATLPDAVSPFFRTSIREPLTVKCVEMTLCDGWEGGVFPLRIKSEDLPVVSSPRKEMGGVLMHAGLHALIGLKTLMV